MYSNFRGMMMEMGMCMRMCPVSRANAAKTL